jgi:DNA invertase Pin-like site-specific DNA recombinase
LSLLLVFSSPDSDHRPHKGRNGPSEVRGIKIGRPKLGIEVRQRIAQRTAKGETPYAIAKALGIDRHTAAKYAV